MASGNIRGITIEIGGDTKGLYNALKDVNKQSKDLQAELKAVERGLKFDPGNVELVRQKQELLTASIQSTSEKLDVLKKAQSQVEAQFQRGDIGVEQYRAFQRELQSTENEMKRLRSQYDSLNIDQDRLAQVTRELGTFFDATNTDVEQFAGTLGTRLTQAIRDGSASADQMERALRLMGRQALGASTDIDQMREALRSVDNGSSLDKVRVDLLRISQSAAEAEESVKEFGNELGTVVGGLAAGGGIAGVVSSALDASSLRTKIDISFNVPEESKQSIIEAVRTIEAYGIEGEEALEGIRRQWALNKDATDEVNASFVEGAAVIAKAYAGIDFIELVQETNEFAAALEISNEEALAMTNSLLKMGFPPEQLDILSEYGLQMKMVGFNSAEIQKIFEKGIDTKSWNIDNLNDGIKEAKIVMMEFGLEVPKAVAGLLKGTDLSTKQLQTWGQAVAKGGEEGAQAMADVSAWLRTIEDDALRNELAIAVFGTKAEDQGDNLISIFEGIVDAQDKTQLNQEELNGALESMNADPLVRMKDAFAEVMTSLQPLLLMVAHFVAKIAEWVSNNTGLAAALVAIGVTLGVLTGAFAALMPAIGALVGLWPALVGLIGGIGAPILIAVAAIAGLGLAFTALWQESETFRDTLTNVFNSIKDVVTNVLDVVVNFVKEKVTQIKDFWTTEGEQILTAVENAFNGIKGIVETVMPAVQYVIEYVWKAIQNVINGALDVIMGAIKVFSGLFTGDFSKMWEGVKQIFSGAIDLIMGLMSLSFVGGIRTLLANLGKGAFNLMKGMWDDVSRAFINGVKTASTNVTNFVKNLGTHFKNLFTNTKQVFTDLWRTAVDLVTKLSTDAIKAVKDLPSKFLQVGKDIVNGLIKGIGDMFGDVRKKVESLAALIPEWARDILGIASPSRVMAEVGRWTGLGLVDGLDDTQPAVKKAMEDLSGILIDVAENNIQQEKEIRRKANADILKLRNDAADKIADLEKKSGDKILGIQESASKKKKGMTAAQQRTILNSRKDTADKIIKIEEDTASKIAKIESKAMSDSVKLLSTNQKEVLEEIKLFISDKQSLEQMDLIQEAAIWEKSIGLFEDGTKERVEAQKAYQKSLETINSQIISTNQSFQSEMQKIKDNLIKQENDLTKAYDDEFSRRKAKYTDFAGTFEAFVVELKSSGLDLMANLQSQVDGIKQWQEEFAKISNRGINGELLDELSELGVKALPELIALNQLTDEQLSQYSALYQEKAQLARTQAETELIGMKTDTQQKIDDLRKTANNELSKLQTDWDSKIKGITQGTKTELSTLKQIGVDAGQGLLDGLASMEGPLINKATEIANAISSAIQSALDIHSPSRVMKGFGVNVGEGLIVGMDNMISKVAQSSARLSDAMQNAQGSLASSAQSSRDAASGVSSATSSSTTTTHVTEQHFHITISSPKPLDAYESARLSKIALKEAGLQL